MKQDISNKSIGFTARKAGTETEEQKEKRLSRLIREKLLTRNEARALLNKSIMERAAE